MIPGTTHSADVGKALARLRELSSGLVYSSEGDHPFEVLHIANDAAGDAMTPDRLRSALSLPADTPVRSVSLERALGRHTLFVDPMDAEAQALRPRYEALQSFLERELGNAVAFRVGRPPAITVLLLARAPGGGLVGYRTVAIET